MRPTKNSIIVHGSWTAVVIASFCLGSLRKPSSPAGETTRPAKPLGSLTALVSSDSRPPLDARRSELAPGDGGVGLVSRAFGMSSLNGADWQALAQQAVRDPNPIARRLAFSRLLEALTPDNALAIREQLVAFGADGEEWRDFNYSWGALAGKEAILFAAASDEPDLEATLSGWASANPADAIAFLNDLPEEMRGDRERFAESVVAGLANRGTALATDFVLGLVGEGSTRGEKLMELIANKTLRASDPADAAVWSESLPDGPLKAAAMNRIAGEYVKRDPEAAAQWVQRFADQDYATRVVEEVGDGWAERDPVAAVTWLESLPEGRGQVAGLSSVFGDWEDRDPVAASEYLFSMPRSPQRDSAISGFSRGYAWQDPETAIAWAQDIGDPTLREETLTRAGQAFVRREPDSARAWLQNSGLPPETQKRILEPPRRR